MRRTLKVVLLTAIVIAVAVTPVAGEINWSAGVTLTEKETGVQIGSALEAFRNGRLIGCWGSSFGQLPVMVEGLEYRAYAHLPGIRNVIKVVLTPDGGITQWPAEQIEGKGYCVTLPSLPVGIYGLEWAVQSRDKHNRLMLIIIPINWSSKRTIGMVNQTVVQRPPIDCGGFTDQQWFAYLSGKGWVSVEATPDPAYLALMKMQNGPAPAPQPGPAYAPPVPQTERQSSPAHKEHPKDEPAANFEDTATLVITGGSRTTELPLIFEKPVRISKGDHYIFRRSGKFVAEVDVVKVIPGKVIEARILKGGGVRPQDRIFLKED